MSIFSKLVKKLFLNINFRLNRWYNALKTTDSLKIIRRYAIMNSFDGALATFGILIANYLSNVTDPNLIFFICVSSGVSMGISGFWGTFFIEQAEQKKEMHRIEKHLLTTFSNQTLLSFAYSLSSKLTAFVDGISPMITSLVIASPFLILPINIAYFSSIILSFCVFIVLGIAMAKIAREPPITYALKFLLAAVVALFILYIINNTFN